MKKIMFSDKYGLTQAVLEGRKTQTRRIADTAGRLRDITVRQALEEVNKGRACLFDEGRPLALSAYKLGETIAIAQKYADLAYDGEFFRLLGKVIFEKGCYNKMFVKADFMPHRIRITNRSRISANSSNSRSSPTPVTICPTCRITLPTLVRKRFSSPRSPATTRSSWQPTC